MKKIIVCVKDPKLMPERQTPSSICRDLRGSVDFSVHPGEVVRISAGVKTHIPHGRQCKMYARSWLPTKWHLMLANSVAIFDADYRWEYIMQFFNYTKDIVHQEKYARLCQIEFMPYYIWSGQYGTLEVPEIEFIVDTELFDHFEEKFVSERGAGWIWSTGNN